MADTESVYEKVINPMVHLAETLKRAGMFKKDDKDIAAANLSVNSAMSKLEAIVTMTPSLEKNGPKI